MSTPQDMDQLYNILSADAVSPAILEGLKDLSTASKNLLATRLAQTFEPAPSGRMLARLLSLVTEENKAQVTTAFLLNLRSPDSDARKASLYGLQQLQYPAITELALNALRDTDDQVVASACDILLPRAKQDVQLWRLLQQVYAAYKDKAEFYMTRSLLEAHDIDQPTPEAS
jgi:hypothetical protein